MEQVRQCREGHVWVGATARCLACGERSKVIGSVLPELQRTLLVGLLSECYERVADPVTRSKLKTAHKKLTGGQG